MKKSVLAVAVIALLTAGTANAGCLSANSHVTLAEDARSIYAEGKEYGAFETKGDARAVLEYVDSLIGGRQRKIFTIIGGHQPVYVPVVQAAGCFD